MKAKTIVGWSDESFDKKLNEFMSDPNIEIVDVKFTNPIFYYSALILYRDKITEVE